MEMTYKTHTCVAIHRKEARNTNDSFTYLWAKLYLGNIFFLFFCIFQFYYNEYN